MEGSEIDDGIIEPADDFFDDDFIHESIFDDNECNPFHDCTLDDADLKKFLSPSLEQWKDLSSKDNATYVTIDQSKKKQWQLTKQEIRHVRERVMKMLNIQNFDDVHTRDIVSHILGPESDVGLYLQDELVLTKVEYLKFMSTLCTQAAYRISASSLYHSESLLNTSMLMEKKQYLSIWKLLAEKKKLKSSQISSGRRDSPIWMTIEDIVNKILQSISISEREGEIPIALDDDKVWLAIMNCKSDDLFNVKYTTHTQANRKGIILHTAVSTGANVPLGIAVERQFDSATSCLKRLLKKQLQFEESSRDGNGMRNTSVHSDRGYMLPEIVFEFLLSNGAHVLGTVKRLAKCWPFVFLQKVGQNDKRMLVDTKGAPTLFLKQCKAATNSRRKMNATAFRNGTEKVATAVSSMHNQHQWEAIAMHNYDLKSYDEDKNALKSKFFRRVDFEDVAHYNNEKDNEEDDLIQRILDEKIIPVTLEQGMIFITYKFVFYKVVLNLFLLLSPQEAQLIGTTIEDSVLHHLSHMVHLWQLFPLIHQMNLSKPFKNIYMVHLKKVNQKRKLWLRQLRQIHNLM